MIIIKKIREKLKQKKIREKLQELENQRQELENQRQQEILSKKYNSRDLVFAVRDGEIKEEPDKRYIFIAILNNDKTKIKDLITGEIHNCSNYPYLDKSERIQSNYKLIDWKELVFYEMNYVEAECELYSGLPEREGGFLKNCCLDYGDGWAFLDECLQPIDSYYDFVDINDIPDNHIHTIKPLSYYQKIVNGLNQQVAKNMNLLVLRKYEYGIKNSEKFDAIEEESYTSATNVEREF